MHFGNTAYAHRTGKTTLRITGSDGKPLAGGSVAVRQVRHKVLFGCAGFESVPLINGELEGLRKEQTEKFVEKMKDIFNFMTLPFYWRGFEPERGKPDTGRLMKAAKWWREQGFKVKGHPLCWHSNTAPWLLEMSDEDILDAQIKRIERDAAAFSGAVDMWDVINEVVIMPVFDRGDNGITRICKRYSRVELVKKVFDAVKRSDSRALLLINDFDMGLAYDVLLETLLDADVSIDAIGLQSHMHQGYWGAAKTEKVLESFSRFGLPLHFTEINMVSGDIMPAHIEDLNDFVTDNWPSTPEGEERQAIEIEEFYRLLFKCPLVEAITYWNFTDGVWLNAPAGLMTAEARVKPSYETLHRLIKKEWMTPEQHFTADAGGFIKVSGFKGDYTAEFENGTMDFHID